MATPDWYPDRYPDRIPWHANFASQATATGVADGLSAAQVTQINEDSASVTDVVTYDPEVDTFTEGFTQFMRIVLDGELNTPLPPVPAPPAALGLGLGAQAAIQARTRQYANILKAHPAYTQAKGELYGIVAPAGVGPGTPNINTATALVGSEVLLSLNKAGYSVLAVDMRRGGGGWNQIGIAQAATFTDTTDAQTPGQPEQREYRVQGMVANNRVGPLSAVVSAVTIP
jgi:hypothetical protein